MANAAWLPRMLGNFAGGPRVGGRQVRSSAQGSGNQPGTVQVVLPEAELPAIATGRGERRTAGSAATRAPAPAPRPRRCQDPAAERELQPPAPAAAAAPGR